MQHKEKPPLCHNCERTDTTFCELNREMDVGISKIETAKKYQKGSYVFKEGTYPSGIHIINSGKVKIVKTSDEGKEQIVRFSETGDFLGYRALLGNHVYKCSGIALNDVVICHIPKKRFFDILDKNPQMYLELLNKMSFDLARAEEIILSISQKTAKERIVDSLLRLYYRFGYDNKNIINVQLSRKEMGNMAGTTIETTIRTLGVLKKEKLIDFVGKKIRILDLHKLKVIAQYKN